MSNTTTVTAPRCFECGQAAVLTLPTEAVANWRKGAPVQVAFPTMPADEREVLISGTHPACWDAMYA